MKPHRIKGRIHFRRHHWAIAPRSTQTIELIAKLIKEHPEIAKLRIEGHTDKSGRRGANRRLSQKRADEVMRALIVLGVAPRLLEAKGYGWSMPIDKRRGRRARSRNRRVGFLVLEVSGEDNDEKQP
jgi:outer membrane protein OmpA-like peptidoglycan-associated protein